MCQILNKPSKELPKTFKFWPKWQISPNLVTLLANVSKLIRNVSDKNHLFRVVQNVVQNVAQKVRNVQNVEKMLQTVFEQQQQYWNNATMIILDFTICK